METQFKDLKEVTSALYAKRQLTNLMVLLFRVEIERSQKGESMTEAMTTSLAMTQEQLKSVRGARANFDEYIAKVREFLEQETLDYEGIERELLAELGKAHEGTLEQ